MTDKCEPRDATTGAGTAGEPVVMGWTTRNPDPPSGGVAPAVDEVKRAREMVAQTAGPTRSASRTDIGRVIVVLSSSRGGSSLLFSLLRRTGRFLCLQGEHTALYRIHGLLGTTKDSPGHDGMVSAAPDVEAFAASLLAEVTPEDVDARVNATQPDLNGFARRSVLALVQQWSFLAKPVEPVYEAVRKVLHSVRPGNLDSDGFLLAVIRQLRREGFPVDPWYYDLPPERIAQAFPALPRPAHPPPVEVIVEEPPFVVPRAAVAPTERDYIERPLLLKASVDAYRLEMLGDIFPNAKFRVLHLVRNPAASVNGLIDGWQHRGFFSRELSETTGLRVAGYSHLPWGRHWWNFDLPPAWTSLVDKPLPEVCAAQWRSAHESILQSLAIASVPFLRLRAEDLQCVSRRGQLIRRTLRFAGVAPIDRGTDPVTPIMPTAPPRPGRWRDRAISLAPALAEPRTVEIARQLGYGGSPDQDWR